MEKVGDHKTARGDSSKNAGQHFSSLKTPARRGEIVAFGGASNSVIERSLVTPPLSDIWILDILKDMLNKRLCLDLTFQALADASRRTMLARLTRGPASVTDLARPLSISLPAVMQHLAVLEGSGLVRTEKRGRVRTCRIEPQALGQAERWINECRVEWERRLDRLGNYLEAMNDGESADDDNK